MPKYWVQWVDIEGKDGAALIEAKDKRAASDIAEKEHGADEVLEVTEE